MLASKRKALRDEAYHLADLLLFPSRREGFGIPVLEAGLARLPVFAADIPPMQESGGDCAHFFDPEGDPAVVAEAIAAHLAADWAYQLRRHVLSHFTWQAILERHLIPLLKEVTENGKGNSEKTGFYRCQPGCPSPLVSGVVAPGRPGRG